MLKSKLLLVSSLLLAMNMGAAQAVEKSPNAEVVEVVVNANGYPFSFVDDNNNITGYDGDLLKILDERLPEYKFHFNAVSRDAMIVGLSTGAYTLAADHFYLTKERAEKYAHSGQPSAD